MFVTLLMVTYLFAILLQFHPPPLNHQTHQVGGTYASPMLVVPEVCIGAFGKIQTRPAFSDSGEIIAASTMCVSWSGERFHLL